MTINWNMSSNWNQRVLKLAFAGEDSFPLRMIAMIDGTLVPVSPQDEERLDYIDRHGT